MMESAAELQTPRCARCGASLKSAADGLCACCIFNAALTTFDEERASVEASTLVLDKHQFSGYELLGEIARGAMGVVFRARQFRPERIVALKVIASGELASPKMVERFHTEAETAARLEHPHIVPIFEVGNEGHWHFFSMRLIEGPTLAQALTQRRLPLALSVALMGKLARAVHYAHSRGVLHRDIKPGHVLLDAQGEPHLTDFGLAKALEGDSDLTHSEAVLGTPAYMAPEQASGNTRDATTAADVYALGAVLYETLAGRPPFRAENTPALLRKIVEAEPKPPSAFAIYDSRSATATGQPDPRVNRKSSFVHLADLDAICLKCLEKNPTLRYLTAAQFADDLERALNGEPLLARPSTATQRTRKWIRRNPAKAGLAATAAVAVVLITTISLAFNFSLTRARDAARATAEESRDRLVTQHLRENANWNAAGHAFLGTVPLLEALRIETNSTRRQPIEERLAATLNFSPRLLHVWNAGDVPVAVQFTRDGQRLVASLRSSAARAWDLTSGKALPASIESSRSRRSPAVISPNGMRVLEFFKTRDRYASVWNIGTGEATPLALDSGGGGAGAFSADGKMIATGGSHVRLWNPDTGEQLPITVTNDFSCTWLAFSPDGRRLLTAQGKDKIWLWQLPSGERDAEPITAVHSIEPKFSPDGESLLLSATGRVQVVNLATHRIDLSVWQNVMMFELNFHPDGETFATAAWNQQVRVWDYPSGVSGPPTITHESGANHAVFSPDGTLFATAGFDYEVRLVREGSHRPVAPAMRHASLIESLAFSPDGRLLAIGDANGVVEVWDLETSAKPVLVGDASVRLLAMNTDASCAAVVNADGELRLMNPTTGRTDPLEGANDAPAFHGAFDQAGRYLSAAMGTNGAAVWETATRKLLNRMATNKDVRLALLNKEGNEVITATSTGTLQRCGVQSGQPVGIAMECGEPISLLRWSDDARWIAAGGKRTLHVFDARSGGPLGAPIQLDRYDSLSEARFTRDGTKLVLCAKNEAIIPGAARLLELPSLRVLALLQHSDGLTALAFSPDEKLIATGGEDNVIRVWRASDGQQVSSDLRHNTILNGVLFRPDGRVLASGCLDGTLRLWNLERDELIAPVIQLGGSVRPVAFNAPGTELFVAVHGSSMLWKIPVTREVPGYVAQLAECLTGSRVDASLRARPLPAEERARVFAQLRALDPARFAMPTDLARWHRQRAAIAEQESNWFTAIFHLERLSSLGPLSNSEQARLNAARQRWNNH